MEMAKRKLGNTIVNSAINFERQNWESKWNRTETVEEIDGLDISSVCRADCRGRFVISWKGLVPEGSECGTVATMEVVEMFDLGNS